MIYRILSVLLYMTINNSRKCSVINSLVTSSIINMQNCLMKLLTKRFSFVLQTIYWWFVFWEAMSRPMFLLIFLLTNVNERLVQIIRFHCISYLRDKMTKHRHQLPRIVLIELRHVLNMLTGDEIQWSLSHSIGSFPTGIYIHRSSRRPLFPLNIQLIL